MHNHTSRFLGVTIAVLAAAGLVTAQQQVQRQQVQDLQVQNQPKAQPPKPLKDGTAKAGDWTFSGPYTHGNLAIFLIHGKDTISGKQLLTLSEALAQKKIVVHETKNVNQLSVENVSDADVFIQAGDIVKGGQQDRVLGYDMILTSKSGKVPLPSFCVESGRWQKRGSEDSAKFGSSDYQANGKALKLAINQAKQQGTVWNKVKEVQTKLSKNVGKDVSSKESPTSLQLTLEDKKVVEALEGYTKALAKVTDGKKDVIGYAMAINGKVEGADVYGSSALFLKLWPKVLNACAVDALAELQKDKKFEPAMSEAVKKFLADSEAGKMQETDVTKRIQVMTLDSVKNFFIETCDKEQKNALVHRSYIAK
jgi:hypothetical protein